MNAAKQVYSAGVRDTLVRILERAAAKGGADIFLDFDGDTLSFEQFDRITTRFAHELRKLGLAKGDTLVTISESHADTLTYLFSAAKLGAIWVPINLAYRREFLRHQIDDSGAKLIICDAGYLERLIEIDDRITGVERILCRGFDGGFPPCKIAIEHLDRHRGDDETPIDADVQPGDLAALLYTSGTTGPSKGCMISQNYLSMQGRQQERGFGLAPGVVVWTPLPLFHLAAIGIVIGALTVVTRIAISRRFSVTSFWDDIERSGATRAYLMATIFPLVAHAPDTPAMTRCHGQIGAIKGVPIPPEIGRIWQERFGVGYISGNTYGQTELSCLTMLDYGELAPEGSVGRAADEFDVAILDDADRPVPPGTVGEICARPRHPHVMFDGYWNRPEETARAWRNLWMHTGDLGRMDEQGHVYFVDRKKDYLRSRGENVSSFEVEAVFLNHPAIAEAAIHATSPQPGDDQIKVTIVLKEEGSLSAEALCHWAIDNLPHFAVPRYFEFRAELVKNPTGRVLKYQLRDEGITPATWDREAAGINVRRTK